jgi:hypothetical protein
MIDDDDDDDNDDDNIQGQFLHQVDDQSIKQSINQKLMGSEKIFKSPRCEEN